MHKSLKTHFSLFHKSKRLTYGATQLVDIISCNVDRYQQEHPVKMCQVRSSRYHLQPCKIFDFVIYLKTRNFRFVARNVLASLD